MSASENHCQAQTQSGTPCKNSPMHGSPYCYAHRDYAAAGGVEIPIANQAAGGARTSQAGASLKKADFDLLVSELNSLAEELRRSYPNYTPPSFTPSGMAELLKSNLDKFTPDLQLEIVNELKANLEGTSPKDLIDPETWKGFWYILNYMAQAQSQAALERIVNRLAALPGMAIVSDLKSNLEGTSPREFLDPETWKGMLLIMNYSARATAADLKRKLVGEDEDE